MKKQDTKFIVVTKGSSFTYSSLGEYLNTFYRSDGNEATFMIGTVRKCGFFIPHEIITKIKSQFSDWKKNFEFYSKEGGGKEVPYSIPSRKKSVKEKKITGELNELVKRRKGK